MSSITAQEMETMVAGLIRDDNPPIYDRRDGDPKFWKIPRSIYYYHLTVENGVENTKNFFYNNGNDKIWYDDVEDIVRTLALNAIHGEDYGLPGYVPPRHGGDLFGDVWRRKSYIVILLDDDALTFLKNKAVVVDPSVANNYPNHTFFDAHDLRVDVSLAGDGSETRSAVCFKNHMKRSDKGDDLRKVGNTPDIQKFTLRLIYADLQRRSFYFFDSGGTNMGPPVPPPVSPA